MACGAGRLSELLPQPVVLLDRDMAMLETCNSKLARVNGRALQLPFADNSFCGALCMRLLQHIPGHQERSAILRELARVTDGPIIVSFFHSLSLQHGRRLLARLLGKPRTGRSAISLGQFARDLQAAGLRQIESRALSPYVSEQRLVLLERTR
jgi:ubiquinone/menaquinone biosynthesis C-methylase UbiE